MSSKSKSNDSGGKKHGFASHFFHHSDDNKKKSHPENDATQQTVPATVRVPPSNSETPNKPEVSTLKPETPSKPDAPLKPAPKGDPVTTTPVQQPEKKLGRRAEAEKRLESAAAGLAESMSKDPAKVPESISLRHLDNIKDVKGTAKQLELAVDRIIDERDIKANIDSRRVWKDCIKSWFKAVYPYVSVGLKEVSVSYLSIYPVDSQLGFCSHSIWICCQRCALYFAGSMYMKQTLIKACL
jgi:hypothetical protein